MEAVANPKDGIKPKFLSAHGIEVDQDALRVIPSGFTDLSQITVGFASLRQGESVILSARLLTRPRIDTSRRDALAIFNITDTTDSLPVFCWGPNAWDAFNSDLDIGELVHVMGVVRENPETGLLSLTDGRIIPATRAGGVEPLYPGDAQRSSSYIEKLVTSPAIRAAAAERILELFPGETSTSVLRRCGVRNGISLEDWLLALHCPTSMAEASTALAVARRLVALEVCFQAMSLQKRTEVPGSAIPIQPKQVATLIASLPFTITGDQEAAIVAMCEDLITDIPSRRLLSGDVGTGKTACFAVPAAAAYMAGAKVVILTPNVLVVEQHLNKLREWWPHIKTLRVNGSTRKLKPAELEPRPILIGTTALISRLQANGYVPDLLIVDEQHKLSTEQREFLLGPKTHYVEATATCIPRTMAVVAHGGMDLSVLKECPFQKKVITRIYDVRHRTELFDQVSKILKLGGQVAVIYPRIEAREEVEKDRHSFEEALKLWQAKFPGRVQGLHGRMKAEEKSTIINAMRAGEFDLLVTTTVIEVGIDLPDLRAAVVVNADRFGLNQLHQIRGRVARQGGTGGFYLYLPEKVESDTMTRLKMLEQYADGFALAEVDLKLRGFGDLADGTRQSGKAVIRSLFGVPLDFDALRIVVDVNKAVAP